MKWEVGARQRIEAGVNYFIIGLDVFLIKNKTFLNILQNVVQSSGKNPGGTFLKTE